MKRYLKIGKLLVITCVCLLIYVYNYRDTLDTLENIPRPIVTIFTTWKSTPEKHVIHNNTLYNWKLLYPFVIPYLFTNDSTLAEEAIRKGWNVLPISASGNSLQIPILKYMFLDTVKASSETPFYCYANSDILFTQSLIMTLMHIYNTYRSTDTPVLIVGQRTNVPNIAKEEVKTLSSIAKTANMRGKLHSPDALDFFITMNNFPWMSIPNVIVGRIAYDNYLVWISNLRNYNTIDVTKTVLAVHQTAASGNYEGFSHPERDYNKELLHQMFPNIRYLVGTSDCAKRYTDYSLFSFRYNRLVIYRRRFHRDCMPYKISEFLI